MNNNEIIFPTAEEMIGRTVASGLEKLIATVKESARKGHSSIITNDIDEIKFINQKKLSLESLGYVVSIRTEYNQEKFAEIIWGKERLARPSFFHS